MHSPLLIDLPCPRTNLDGPTYPKNFFTRGAVMGEVDFPAFSLASRTELGRLGKEKLKDNR